MNQSSRDDDDGLAPPASLAAGDAAPRPARSASRSPVGRPARRRAAPKSRPAPRWPGCHVAHRRAPWIGGVEGLESLGELAEGAEFPDISIDPEDKVLSVVNATDRERCFFLSLPADAGCTRLRPPRRLLPTGISC